MALQMKVCTPASVAITLAGVLCAPAQAELTPAGQEVSATIEVLCDNLRAINSLLVDVKDQATADAAVPPLRVHLKALFLGMKRIKQLDVKSTTNEEDYALLMRQVLELQLLQGDFERHCMYVAGQQFYGSAKLARLFQAMAELYRRESYSRPAFRRPANSAAEDDEKLRKRQERHQERLKFYQNH